MDHFTDHRAWRQDCLQFCRDYGVCFLPIVFLSYIAIESYQIDFRSMYLAGKSVVQGLDPYINYVGVNPEFYGPVNSGSEPFSGFRYPPLAAITFAPLGLLPYTTARFTFTAAMLVCLVGLIFYLVRQQRFAVPDSAVLFVMVSFPVLATVERGQVDVLIVVLSVLSFRCWQAQTSKQTTVAALLLATAGMLKVFPFVLLIFYAARRQWSLVAKTVAFSVGLFGLPYPFLVQSSYLNFARRSLPGIFGALSTDLPTQLTQQGITDGIVHSVDSVPLLAMHNFSSGQMNPWLYQNTVGAAVTGMVLSGLLLTAMNRTEVTFQFYAFLSLINLFNPVSWIMGLVWYIPFFLHLSPIISNWGRFILLAPLFFPPALHANAMLAYMIAIGTALTTRLPIGSRFLYKPANQTGAEEKVLTAVISMRKA